MDGDEMFDSQQSLDDDPRLSLDLCSHDLEDDKAKLVDAVHLAESVQIHQLEHIQFVIEIAVIDLEPLMLRLSTQRWTLKLMLLLLMPSSMPF